MKKLTPTFLGLILCLFVSVAAGLSQTPFTTDDADVTDRGKFHLEFLNEYDLLQKSAHPSLRQDSAVARFALGLRKNVEFGLDIPVVTVFNAHDTMPRRPFGLSDISAHLKIKLKDEKDGSRLPALAIAFYARFPTGSASRSLGSGVNKLPVVWRGAKEPD